MLGIALVKCVHEDVSVTYLRHALDDQVTYCTWLTSVYARLVVTIKGRPSKSA
jgi:hypothetical protein